MEHSNVTASTFLRTSMSFAILAMSLGAQTNSRPLHNGIEYFFQNTVVPPSNVTTITRSFGSVSNMANLSGASEGAIHPIGVQQDAFDAWSGQAGGAPSVARPLGFSLLEFRRGGTFLQATGTVVATTSWAASLPCAVPWIWLVTFTWGTTFTHTATASGSAQRFHFSVRGELNQSLGNQNYFTGSGNERNLNSGGISFLEDTSTNLAIQLVSNQEWSPSYYQVDALTEAGRDPSGMGLGFGIDFGTGGRLHRSASTSINPGQPRDGLSFQHKALQQLNGRPQTMITLLTAPQLGGGFAPDGAGSFVLPANDLRTTNLIADPVLTNLGLSLATVLTTGGVLGGVTGDTGLSGVANTLQLDLTMVSVPPALMPFHAFGQSFAIQPDSMGILQFTVLSNGVVARFR